MLCSDADWAHVSKEAKDFCSALMMKRPRDRLNATDAIHHPWIAHKSTVHQGKDAAHEMLDMEQHHHNIIASLEAFCAADDLKKLALEVYWPSPNPRTRTRPNPNPGPNPEPEPNPRPGEIAVDLASRRGGLIDGGHSSAAGDCILDSAGQAGGATQPIRQDGH